MYLRGSSLNLIDLSIVINTKRREFECVGMHCPPIYELGKFYK